MLHKLKAFAHLLLFRRSSARGAIERDMLRWLQVYKIRRPGRNVGEVLAWLLAEHPEFRNVFYVRIGRYSGIAPRALLGLAKRLHPPMETFRFAEPLDIGPGFFARRGFGTVVGARSIGENCWIDPGVTLGYKDAESGLPTVGHNVHIGAGAKVLGSVLIGDGAIIGANAVVTRDVPPRCTVAGVPARIVSRDGVRAGQSRRRSADAGRAGASISPAREDLET